MGDLIELGTITPSVDNRGMRAKVEGLPRKIINNWLGTLSSFVPMCLAWDVEAAIRYPLGGCWGRTSNLGRWVEGTEIRKL